MEKKLNAWKDKEEKYQREMDLLLKERQQSDSDRRKEVA